MDANAHAETDEEIQEMSESRRLEYIGLASSAVFDADLENQAYEEHDDFHCLCFATREHRASKHVDECGQ